MIHTFEQDEYQTLDLSNQGIVDINNVVQKELIKNIDNKIEVVDIAIAMNQMLEEFKPEHQTIENLIKILDINQFDESFDFVKKTFDRINELNEFVGVEGFKHNRTVFLEPLYEALANGFRENELDNDESLSYAISKLAPDLDSLTTISAEERPYFINKFEDFAIEFLQDIKNNELIHFTIEDIGFIKKMADMNHTLTDLTSDFNRHVYGKGINMQSFEDSQGQTYHFLEEGSISGKVVDVDQSAILMEVGKNKVIVQGLENTSNIKIGQKLMVKMDDSIEIRTIEKNKGLEM